MRVTVETVFHEGMHQWDDAVDAALKEHKSGVGQRGMTREREVLTEIWKPYLDGRGTRDEAFAAIIKRLSERV